MELVTYEKSMRDDVSRTNYVIAIPETNKRDLQPSTDNIPCEYQYNFVTKF